MQLEGGLAHVDGSADALAGQLQPLDRLRRLLPLQADLVRDRRRSPPRRRRTAAGRTSAPRGRNCRRPRRTSPPVPARAPAFLVALLDAEQAHLGAGELRLLEAHGQLDGGGRPGQAGLLGQLDRAGALRLVDLLRRGTGAAEQQAQAQRRQQEEGSHGGRPEEEATGRLSHAGAAGSTDHTRDSLRHHLAADPGRQGEHTVGTAVPEKADRPVGEEEVGTTTVHAPEMGVYRTSG